MRKELYNLDGARDEKIKDPRDWVGTLNNYLTLDDLPEEFVIEDDIYISQDKDGYKMSCSAQGTINASNGSRKIKRDSRRDLPEDLRDIVIDKGLGGNWGSYLIDVIKEAKKEGIIVAYYQTNTLIDILNAIYSTNLISTGTNKINWYDSRDGLVKKITKGPGHAFAIIGWNKIKKIGDYVGAIKCKNSYGKNEYDNGCFWIPFDLVEDILFNTKKALIVVPEWTKIGREERNKIYNELKKKYN